MKSNGVLRISLFLVCWFYSISCSKPSQIHLSVGSAIDEMHVSWATEEDTSFSQVRYGLSPDHLDQVASGTSHHYFWVDIYESPQLHDVLLTGLQPNTKYYYQCGDPSVEWSDTFSFSTDRQVPLRIISFGDNGVANSSQMVLDAMLKVEQEGKPFNFLLHSGDLSYANGIQPYWDKWGNMIQGVANHIPYMVSVGNHELFSLFVAYLARFRMPNRQKNPDNLDLYYSFDYSLVHVIALASEVPEYWHVLPQYQFLKEDLAKVNRTNTPWIICMWHNPWWSSNKNHQGSGDAMKAEYEDLFYQYKVDLVLNGHVHAYERTYSVYKGNLVPDAPEFRTVGTGGNGEGLYDSWIDPKPSWSAFRSGTFYGFGTLDIYNSTHLFWQMWDAEYTEVKDSSWIIRNRD